MTDHAHPERDDLRQGTRRPRAASDVRYALGGACSRFKASVGVADRRPDRLVNFEVYADTTKMYDSGFMTATTHDEGDRRLHRRRERTSPRRHDGGDDIESDHGDWALAPIECRCGGGDSTPRRPA